ncbi:MAG TPA: hypothetical protein PKW37_03710 [Salinivirgaceae bacterium]|nr:hypothetical protein [Salinivirgaceae bacterium]
MTMRLSGLKITIPLLFVAVTTHAQKFAYDIDFTSYFDNREYKGPFQIPQTIFAYRFAPTAGVVFIDTLQGTHSVMLGTHYIQPIGANLYESKILPTAYYGYQKKGFAVHLGAVPYKKRVATLPHFLMYDSCAYAHPNIQGGIFQYSSKLGFAEFMCDWRGAQSPERREMFRLILNGQFKHKWFFTGGFAQLNHKANFAKPTPREGVADDVYLNAYVGSSFGEIVEKIDSLSIKCGYIFGFQRDRSVDQTTCPKGVLSELYFK